MDGRQERKREEGEREREKRGGRKETATPLIREEETLSSPRSHRDTSARPDDRVRQRSGRPSSPAASGRQG